MPTFTTSDVPQPGRAARRSTFTPLVGALLLGALLAPGAAQAGSTLSAATLFRADATGSNISATLGNQITRGAWTSVLDQQNVPGNFGGEFFLSTVANPTAGQFLTPAAALAQPLATGVNTFYFFADGDDQAGGSVGFGLNLFFDGAAQSSPGISAFAAPGQAFSADTSTTCTSGYAFTCVAGSGALAATSGTATIQLTDFQLLAIGGAAASGACTDLVNSTNTAAFTPPPQPDGICDTTGSFTLTLSQPTTAPVPEPGSVAPLATGLLGLAAALGIRGSATRPAASSGRQHLRRAVKRRISSPSALWTNGRAHG